MDYQALKAEIIAGGFDLQNRDDGAIAAALSVGRTKIVSPTMIGVGTILANFGGQGGVFLDTLATISETNRDIHWLLEANIKRGEFDIGNAASRYGMEQLASQLPPFAAGITALMNLAVVPDPVSANDVAKALEGV